MDEKLSQLEFLREGLARYADARETVNYFQTSILEALFRVFEAKMNWKNFEPVRVEGNLESAKYIGNVYITAYIAGTLRNRKSANEKVFISLGLYWNPPLRRSASVVAYSACWTEKNTPVPFNPPKPGSGVTLGSIGKKSERYILLEPGTDFDPDVSFALLLDAADDALGIAETVGDTVGDAQ